MLCDIVQVYLLSHTSVSAVVMYDGHHYFVSLSDLYLSADERHYDIYIGCLNDEAFISEPYDEGTEDLASII